VLNVGSGWRSPSTRAVFTASLIVAIVVAGPLLDAAGQGYWVIVLTRALLLAVLAIASDLVWGITGIFALGQAVFFGAGAYAAGLLSTRAGMTSLILLVPATAVVGLVGGLLIGAFLFFGRRRVGELYVALVTLALTYALEQLANVWNAIGAGNGITGLPLPSLLGQQIQIGLPFFWIALTALLATLAVGWLLLRSQFGLVLRAIRDDAERAEFLGYRRSVVQLTVFALAAAMAAVGGGLYALEEGFVSPSFLGVTLSTQVLIYILLGGRGTLIGPVLGVLVLEVGGQRIQQSLPTDWPIIVGSILLLVIVFLPRGLLDARTRVTEVLALLQRRSMSGGDQSGPLSTAATDVNPHGN
jgi:ABC-type branched-subunit amino acid transport system permease subunit